MKINVALAVPRVLLDLFISRVLQDSSCLLTYTLSQIFAFIMLDSLFALLYFYKGFLEFILYRISFSYEFTNSLSQLFVFFNIIFTQSVSRTFAL